jgi:hypothetical protein
MITTSKRCAVRMAAPIALALALAGSADRVSGQYLGGGTMTAAQAQVADLEQVRDKFVALAGAFPDSTYDWRPMEGVRSVRQVFTLVASEATLFPTMWSFEKPAWADASITGEQARVAALSREQTVTEIRRSFDHLLGLVRGLNEADRNRQVSFFGLNVDLGTAITLMATDMHEHLGQAIAYARMNRIVPPWSQR